MTRIGIPTSASGTPILTNSILAISQFLYRARGYSFLSAPTTPIVLLISSLTDFYLYSIASP